VTGTVPLTGLVVVVVVALSWVKAEPLTHIIIRCQDTSDPGHFGPKTFRHHQTGAEVSGQFGTSAEVSFGHFGTSAELSRPQAQIFRIS